MSNKKLKEIKEEILSETASDPSSDSEIEIKPKKERKPYVLTEARKKQFEIARIKRQENVAQRKLIQAEKNKEFIEKKNKIQQKNELKEKRKQEKELQKLAYKSVVELESESEEEKIIVKKKKPKKKIIYIDSDSESEDEVYRKSTKKSHRHPPTTQPRQIRPLVYF